jgi:cyanophycinase
MLRSLLAVVAFFFVAALPPSPSGGAFDRTGSLLLVGGGKIGRDLKRRFLELAGGPGARIVVIPSASALAESADEAREFWQQEGSQVVVLHTNSRAEADSPSFCHPLRWATGVWITGGDQSRFMSFYGGTGVQRELVRLYRRGGVIGGTSAGASVASRLMIAGEGEGEGLGLLDGVIVDQHFDTRRRLLRLLNLLKNHPDQLGLGIDEGTGVVIQFGKLSVVGERTVSLCRHGSGPEVHHAGERFCLNR